MALTRGSFGGREFSWMLALFVRRERHKEPLLES